MSQFLFHGGSILDPEVGELREGIEVLVADGLIREVSDTPLKADDTHRIDIGRRTLMPGLIDAHVHVVWSYYDAMDNAMQPSSLATLRAARNMQKMLARGFTTVRDVGGADAGLAIAVREGLVPGPRLVICGKALGPSGGHTDYRGKFDDRDLSITSRVGSWGRVCDGEQEIRRAVREEIKAGAQFIKVMGNGGVGSPNDPIESLGFSRAELLAVVDEAAARDCYVAAHLYTDKAIRLALECGVHSLEHCNLISASTARYAAECKAIAVPTLSIFEAIAQTGSEVRVPRSSIDKMQVVKRAALDSLECMRTAGLAMAYGSDCVGPFQAFQSAEFSLREGVLTRQEIISSATVVAARLCRMEGRVGIIAPGAIADLLVVDGNPLEDLSVLQNDGERLALIMRDGKVFKNLL